MKRMRLWNKKQSITWELKEYTSYRAGCLKITMDMMTLKITTD